MPDEIVHDTRCDAVAIFWGVFGALLAAMTLLAFLQVRSVLAVLFLGVVLGVTMAPAANLLSRYHVPRAVSVLGIYGLAVGLLLALGWYAVPELAREYDEFVVAIDTFRDDYSEWAEGSGFPPWDELQDRAMRAASGYGPGLASSALLVTDAVLYTFTILAVGLFITLANDAPRRLVLSMVDEPHRQQWDAVLHTMAGRLRRYVLGELVSMTIVGGLVYAGLIVLGVPAAFVLAAFAFLTELLPLIGPFIAFVPIVAVAFTQGVEVAIAAAILVVIVQQIESNILVPIIQRRGTHVPEVIILAAILLGGTWMGILGALVALPLAVIGHTIATEVIVPWRQREVIDEAAGEAGPPAAAP